MSRKAFRELLSWSKVLGLALGIPTLALLIYSAAVIRFTDAQSLKFGVSPVTGFSIEWTAKPDKKKAPERKPDPSLVEVDRARPRGAIDMLPIYVLDHRLANVGDVPVELFVGDRLFRLILIGNRFDLRHDGHSAHGLDVLEHQAFEVCEPNGLRVVLQSVADLVPTLVAEPEVLEQAKIAELLIHCGLGRGDQTAAHPKGRNNRRSGRANNGGSGVGRQLPDRVALRLVLSNQRVVIAELDPAKELPH